MRRSLGVSLALVALLVAPLALACRPPQPSGEALGTYSIVGTLEENGCRPGLEPIDPLRYTAELRRDHELLTWRISGGGRPVGGTLRADGSFRLSTRTDLQAWPPDARNAVVGCTLSQIETVTGTMVIAAAADAGVPDGGVAAPIGPESFGADNAIEIAPTGGSDCSALLIANGGSFPTFPCTARYRLEAERTD